MDVKQLEQELLPLTTYAVPVILISVVLEWWITRHDEEHRYHARDFWASLGIGAGSLVINAILKTSVFAFGLFFYHLIPWRIETAWWTWILGYLLIDLCNYFAHFIAHKQRVWWATHVTHHSSEHLNFTTAFRNSWTQHLKLIFFIPAWASGIDPIVLFTCYQIDLLYQFWIHTEVIRKMPRWFEAIFVTPSHHRVHHGSNPRFIDKNFGSSLIIWDRLFGTFQEEDEVPEYGLTKPIESFNPVYLNFHVWIDIWRDVRQAKSVRAALSVLFGPP
ncbi:sterol desaturase family protein [Tellurirhabdus bombi]|uniref:sterol desaturase family protein n=1 Tax=Tellurirhabdus bombi TaxID=2907205 RepID=UPI001F46B6F3|nr:sterol desaturase family protein [Tellurirhabdus bombi]